jgi:hypothetical protein
MAQARDRYGADVYLTNPPGALTRDVVDESALLYLVLEQRSNLRRDSKRVRSAVLRRTLVSLEDDFVSILLEEAGRREEEHPDFGVDLDRARDRVKASASRFDAARRGVAPTFDKAGSDDDPPRLVFATIGRAWGSSCLSRSS